MSNKKLGYLVIILAGMFGALANEVFHAVYPTVEVMQDKYDGYRLCMQTAGTTHCYMTPADFTEYFKLQRELGER